MSSREQFEAWWKGKVKNHHLAKVGTADGPYASAVMQGRWEIWQAATASTQEQMAALAAENLALKNFAANHSRAAQFWNSWADSEDKIQSEAETPATDAFIAEQQAIGVEKFASAVQGGSAISDRVIDLATNFAQRLRNEVKS